MFASAGCTRPDRGLEERIAAEALRDGAIVRIETLTDFAWTRLHIFPPYSSQAEIDRELGFEWPAARTGIFDSDGITLLIFVHEGAVVRHVTQPRGKGDFADVKVRGGLTPHDAIFTVRTDESGRSVFVRVMPGATRRQGRQAQQGSIQEQMQADTRKFNDSQAPGDRAICERLAGEIDRGLPDAENTMGHAHPVWGGNPIVGYSQLKNGVRLLAAEARFTAADQVDVKKLPRWLAQARDVQWDYRNLVRRKGQLQRLK